jgi:hypothetical protein
MKPRLAIPLAVVIASSAVLFALHDAAEQKPERRVEALETRRERPSTTPETPALSPALVTVAPNAAGDERTEPHPITAARAAIADQNALFLAVESALKARDVVRARLLLREHEQHFAGVEGGAEDRDGFEAIAKCIEQPGAESRANAELFIAEHRASPLRRKVRHACLGARAPTLLR